MHHHQHDSLFLAAIVAGCMPSAGVLHQLLATTGSAQVLWESWSPSFLNSVLPPRSANGLIDKGFAWLNERHLDHIQTIVNRLGIQILRITELPEPLQHSPDPPACLFLRGSTDCLTGRLLGVVGTRQATSYSEQVLPLILNGLTSANPTIVSGLAAGVDYLAHRTALAAGFPTVAIFGTGIDTIYPKAHRPLVEHILESGGACISEYPPGFPGNKYTFPNRNRIIAGLCAGILLTECAIKSGAMITARLALEAGRDVFALPGSLLNTMSAGPNSLIAQGATLVSHADDILQNLDWAATPKEGIHSTQTSLLTMLSPNVVSAPSTEPPIAQELQPVWSLLKPREPVPLYELQQQLNCSGDQLAMWLTFLELDGHIQQLPGQSVIRLH